MREKFFEEGHYKLRLDHIQPKEAKPHNRIHLNCSMPLLEDDLKHAPTKIRRLAEIVANIELDTSKILLTTKLPGIDIEIFPTPPTAKTVPVIICLTNCILRDLQLNRSKKGELRLYFAIGIAWDTGVWKWGGKQFSMDCFAKFSKSQTELFDDHPADQAITQPSAEQVEALAQELAGNRPASPQTPLIDPLEADSKRKRGHVRKSRKPGVLAFNKKGSRDVRPNA